MSVLRKWEELPEFMQNEEVKVYYDTLSKKKRSILVKFIFDYIFAMILSILLVIPMIIIAIFIKIDSDGPVFYRQQRVTRYGRIFRIHKFRTMTVNAENIGSTVTLENDDRVTRVGRFLRKYRLDEVPQLIDILQGNMSIVGARPEAKKYVKYYIDSYNATFLLPAGITSETSLLFKDESKLLNGIKDVDKYYVENILPLKMKYNLHSLKNFNILNELLTIIKTVLKVFFRR